MNYNDDKDKITKNFKSEISKNNFNLMYFITSVVLLFVSIWSVYYTNPGRWVIANYWRIEDMVSFYYIKLLVFLTSVWVAYKIYKNNPNSKMILLYGALAVIYNPVFKIMMRDDQWISILICTTIIYIYCGIKYIINSDSNIS